MLWVRNLELESCDEHLETVTSSIVTANFKDHLSNTLKLHVPSSCWIPYVKSFNSRTIIWYIVKSALSVLRWTKIRWIFTSSPSSVLLSKRGLWNRVIRMYSASKVEQKCFSVSPLMSSLLQRADTLRSGFTDSQIPWDSHCVKGFLSPRLKSVNGLMVR